MRKINSKYAEYLLAPANAITDDEVETLDGVRCKLVYQETCNNSDRSYDERLNDICQRYYGCPFSTIRSIWIGRLNYLSDYWHLVKMVKI